MTTKTSTPNDQRSDTKNPNNPAYDADRANRDRQAQPNPPLTPAPQPAPTGNVKGKR